MRFKTKIKAILSAVCLAVVAPMANAGINDGMVAYYCFDDVTNLGKDCSGNNNQGTAEGTVTAATGYKGFGASFNAVFVNNDVPTIHVPNSPSLQFTTALSISYVVKLNTLVGMPGDEFATNQAIVAKSHDATGWVLIL